MLEKGKYRTFIDELFVPSQSGINKLIAAWPGLTLFDKLKALDIIHKNTYPNYLHERLYENLSLDDNTYVQYIVEKTLGYKNEEGQNFQNKTPLVKYAYLEHRNPLQAFFNRMHADDFYSLPQEARLAIARSLRNRGNIFSDILTSGLQYIENNKITVEELHAILLDYLLSPNFKSRYIDCSDEIYDYCASKDISSLWKLVHKMPLPIADLLLSKLPESAHNTWGCDIPSEVLEGLTPDQIYILLYRKDIKLLDFRKKIFFDAQYETWVRGTAAKHHINFTSDEFETLLPKSLVMNSRDWCINNDEDKEKFDMLLQLSFANDLDLVYYQILNDIFLNTNGSCSEYEDYDPIQMLEKHLFLINKEPMSSKNRRNLINLKLYELARNIIPWDKNCAQYYELYSIEHELNFLKKGIVQNSTWKTFKNFADIWNSFNTLKHYNFLPEIYGFDEEHISETYLDGKINFNTQKIEIDFFKIEEKLEALEKKIITASTKQNLITLAILAIILLFK